MKDNFTFSKSKLDSCNKKWTCFDTITNREQFNSSLGKNTIFFQGNDTNSHEVPGISRKTVLLELFSTSQRWMQFNSAAK